MAATSVGHADSHGRDADGPIGLSGRAWRDILSRVWRKTGTDNISLLAAGIAFYAFLSFVPLLAALVMTYGLIADPATIQSHMAMVVDLMPKDAANLVLDQLVSLTNTAAGKKGLGLAVALVIALYGATRASGAIIMALNVVYEQAERRNILQTTAVSFALIVGAVMVAIVGMLAASALALVGRLATGLGMLATVGINIATFAVAALLTSIAIGVCYRVAPDRRDAQWRWVSTGSALATLLWLIATLGFGAYASTIGNYNATYGSLGAVVILLMWLWVSAYAILLGAEINAESERQTAQDTAIGSDRPQGRRDAVVADQTADQTADHGRRETTNAS